MPLLLSKLFDLVDFSIDLLTIYFRKFAEHHPELFRSFIYSPLFPKVPQHRRNLNPFVPDMKAAIGWNGYRFRSFPLFDRSCNGYEIRFTDFDKHFDELENFFKNLDEAGISVEQYHPNISNLIRMNPQIQHIRILIKNQAEAEGFTEMISKISISSVFIHFSDHVSMDHIRHLVEVIGQNEALVEVGITFYGFDELKFDCVLDGLSHSPFINCIRLSLFLGCIPAGDAAEQKKIRIFNSLYGQSKRSELTLRCDKPAENNY